MDLRQTKTDPYIISCVCHRAKLKPCLSKESWYGSSGEMMDNARLWTLSSCYVKHTLKYFVAIFQEIDINC